MNEPKPLPPSLRPKKRYIIFQVISETPVTFVDFSASVWNSFLSLLGEFQSSDAKIWVIKNLYDEKKQKGVIRCHNAHIEKVRSALSFVSVIGESKAIIKILGVTGTIKSARDKYADLSLKNYG